MPSYFTGQRSFSSLSIKDLLEAQEAYHVHLAHLDNVLATAISRFRIRDTDPDFENPESETPSARAHTSARGQFRGIARSSTAQRPYSL